MDNPIVAFAVGKIKGLLKKAIVYYKSDSEAITTDQIAIWIKAKDDSGDPKYRILKDLKLYKEIEFKDLIIKSFDELTISAMLQTTDVPGKCNGYIQNFILRCCADYKVPVTVPFFLLLLRKNDIIPIMYVGDKQVPVTLDYIIG